MRIYTKAGDLAFTTFTFPDGQPHFKLETYEREFEDVTIELALKTPSDLFLLCLVCSVLRQHGYAQVNLDIRYLLGARMDRAISSTEPHTLQVVARLINSCGFSRVRILDAHSEVATKLIRNSSNVLPFKVVEQVFTTVGGDGYVVCPDKGARDRVRALTASLPGLHLTIQGDKLRDPTTGRLSGFKVKNCPSGGSWDCLIIDDICDGGGTFVGLSAELRKFGASKISLFITHGIFSKGLPLAGIDRVFTTDSYSNYEESSEVIYPGLVVVPISMKDL